MTVLICLQSFKYNIHNLFTNNVCKSKYFNTGKKVLKTINAMPCSY